MRCFFAVFRDPESISMDGNHQAERRENLWSTLRIGILSKKVGNVGRTAGQDLISRRGEVLGTSGHGGWQNESLNDLQYY